MSHLAFTKSVLQYFEFTCVVLFASTGAATVSGNSGKKEKRKINKHSHNVIAGDYDEVEVLPNSDKCNCSGLRKSISFRNNNDGC